MSVDIERTQGGRSTVRDMLFDAERRLNAVGIPSPAADAAWIISHALGIPRNRLILQDDITDEQRVHVEQLLTQRLSRVPLQHLLGSTGFRRIDLEVGPGVFIPRPETELVAEAAIRELREQTQAQLKASYQAQLADAARYTDDKVYTEALRIYNSILSSDRDFEEAILARQRLYTKMVGQARMTYQEALIYESVGDLENATAGFQKTKELLASVDDYEGREYYKKAERKLTRLQR